MIDFSQYDYSKVKEEDKELLYQAEIQNLREWNITHSFWFKLLFSMQKKYYLKSCLNYKNEKKN